MGKKPWSILGMLAVKAVPRIIEALSHRDEPGEVKRAAAVRLILGEIADLHPMAPGKPVWDDPRVQAVLGELVDATVKVQTVMALVEAERH